MFVDSSEEEFEQQLVTYTLQIAGGFVVLENVPSRVSLRTGERFFSPETVEQLQQIVWEQESPVRVPKLTSFDTPQPSPKDPSQ